MFWQKSGAIGEIEQLAAGYRRTGNLAQAKSLYTCLIAMEKQKNGQSDVLALHFYQLGQIYDEEGNRQAANTYYKRAAETWKQVHPEDGKSPFWYREALNRLGPEQII
jgi:tetratricopeptide (TPR) repeat protein